VSIRRCHGATGLLLKLPTWHWSCLRLGTILRARMDRSDPAMGAICGLHVLCRPNWLSMHPQIRSTRPRAESLHTLRGAKRTFRPSIFSACGSPTSLKLWINRQGSLLNCHERRASARELQTRAANVVLAADTGSDPRNRRIFTGFGIELWKEKPAKIVRWTMPILPIARPTQQPLMTSCLGSELPKLTPTGVAYKMEFNLHALRVRLKTG
jgi:hypothetical protein